jgi:hypothetical protein
MNKWFRRAVGTVGVAGGMLLLGAGAAHAEDTAPTAGALDDLISPAGDMATLGGPDNLGVTVDTPGARWSAGALDDGPVAFGPNTGEVGATVHTPGERGQARDVFAGGRLPDVLRSLPAQDLLEMHGLHGLSGLSPTTGDGLVPSGGRGLASSATERTEALPNVTGLPLVDGHLPVLAGQGLPPLDATSVRGTLRPVDDFAIPVGGRDTEAALPVVGDVLENNAVRGLPSLPEVLNSYLPRHAVPDTESLPLVGSLPRHAAPDTESLPLVGSLPLTGLPLVGNLLAGGGGLLGR